MRGEFCGAPHAFERRRAAAFQLFACGRNFLELFTQGLHGRVGVLPRVNEGLGIEWADEPAHFVQLEQLRARWNEQANSELNRSNGFDQIETMELLEKVETAFHGGPWRKRDKSRLESEACAETVLDDAEEIRARVVFVELAQHGIIEGFDGRNYEKTARLAQSGQKVSALQEMLDLDGRVVSELRKFTVQRVNERNGVADAIEEVGIAERNVLRASRHLLANTALWATPKRASEICESRG